MDGSRVRDIAVVTVGRSDWGIYLPVLKGISNHPQLRLRILVSGMHLAAEYGRTDRDIRAAGFEIWEAIESLVASDTPEAIAKSIGLGTIGFAQAFSRSRPDILMVLGDRFDMLPAGLAAVPFNIPIAHLHGGEVTEGAMDDVFRHALSKMSHLHFVSTEEHAARLRQMGEEAWRITVSGAPAIDGICRAPLMSPDELAATFGVNPDEPMLLVTYHPVTREYSETEFQITALLDALSRMQYQCVFTYPNADTCGRIIIEKIEAFSQTYPRCRVVKNAGQRGYWSLMSAAAVVVGNSSSGILEAPSFRVPVVNIGTRQRGRTQASNVINCGYESDEIHKALLEALSRDFRESLRDVRNPYGDGSAASRIVERLAEVDLGPVLVTKHFVDKV